MDTHPSPPPAAPDPGDPPTQPASKPLPPQSRFPILTSGQYRLAIPAEKAVTFVNGQSLHRYHVRVELQCTEPGQSFQSQSYTLMVRRFLYALSAVDPLAAILPRTTTSKANKILCNVEIPDINTEFEKYYAWGVIIHPRRVFLKMSMETTDSFAATFKRGKFFDKMNNERWWVHKENLETQGKVADIGYLLRAHNRFTNQVDTIREIRKLIEPAQITDLDLTVDQPSLHYLNEDTMKKEKVSTRWLKIRCPVDIAEAAKDLLISKWPDLRDDKYSDLNICNFQFVPYSDMFTKSDRLHHMAEQNIFLSNHREITVLAGCNMDLPVTFTPELATVFGTESLLGQIHTLRYLLNTWAMDGVNLIASIDLDGRAKDKDTFFLLAHKSYASMVRKRMDDLVRILRKTSSFKNINIGNSRGLQHASPQKTPRDYSARSTNYLQGLKSNLEYKFNLPRPEMEENSTAASTSATSDGSRKGMEIIVVDDEDDDNWKSPPKNKQVKKSFKAQSMVDYTNQHTLNSYRDVLSNPYHQAPQTPPGNSSLARRAKHSTAYPPPAHPSQYLQPVHPASLQEQLHAAIKTPTFTEALRKAVLPQVRKEVNDIVTPTVNTIKGIEKNVDEFKIHIDDSKLWRDQQQQQLDALQMGINSVAQGVTQMTAAFAGLSHPSPTSGKRVPPDPTHGEQGRKKKHHPSPTNTLGNNPSTEAEGPHRQSPMSPSHLHGTSSSLHQHNDVEFSNNGGNQYNTVQQSFTGAHPPQRLNHTTTVASSLTPSQDDDDMSMVGGEES